MRKDLKIVPERENIISKPLILSVPGITVNLIPGPDQSGVQKFPTSPDISLPWSPISGPGGWSAKMWLHQMIKISLPHWNYSDTELLLSEQMPLRLQAKTGSGILLSDVIKRPAQASINSCYLTAKAVKGIVRRSLKRNKSFRVLLSTEHDTIPVIVIFGNRQKKDLEYWTVKSEQPLRDSLKIGLLDFLNRHAPKCTDNALSHKSHRLSAK